MKHYQELNGLPLPCRVNEYWSPKGGRVKGLTKSKKARESTKVLVSEIHERLGGKPSPLMGAVQVSIRWTPRNRVIADVDAYIKITLDALQHAGVYADDKQVVDVQCSREAVPKWPGHMDISVWAIEPDLDTLGSEL